MRKAQDVIGLPVFDINHGKQIGKVIDLCIDPEWRLRGVLLQQSHWFQKGNYIPITSVCSFGEDAVTVEEEESQPLQDLREKSWFGLTTGHPRMKGLPVITVDGHQLGMVEDVYFAEELGIILGYELSDGFLSDLTEGRITLDRPDDTIFGEDAIVIPQHTPQGSSPST
jgi:uncharacterized protein YrrD